MLFVVHFNYMHQVNGYINIQALISVYSELPFAVLGAASKGSGRVVVMTPCGKTRRLIY